MEIVYLNKKLEDFFSSLDEASQADVFEVVNLLKGDGYRIRLPFSRSLGGGLFELRTIGNTQVRIIYTFHSDAIFVLNAFVKKTNKIPKYEIDYARARLKELRSI